MTATTITAAVFGGIDDHSRPALTFYDDATGERTELSWATLGNWAAKTANLLVDEVLLEPGDPVIVDLPEHWQTAGILLGCWWAGARVHTRAEADLFGDATVGFTDRDHVDAHPDVEDLIVAPLDPFAMPVPGLPPGVSDYGTRVRIHGDQFTGPAHAGDALDGRTTSEVLDAAHAAAAGAGIRPGGRVLSTLEWASATGIVDHFLAPLSVGAGLVWVANPDGDQSARAATERAEFVLT
ncbi:TIGR03089 family protein [Gordonia sp. L191]|uniref:TIGR03089 family protein n=1 Tax=Gordonia sp. L191 TaxID=2982699 RepID=UPI0024BF1803|nr:TIGR03089 family protein [Gordonia sp. L191]WHU45315.1 TIGR03089 family protein [Gordonia sp. L191]